MLTPADLGLPPKFAEWRPIDRLRTQEDVVIAAACSDKRFVILNAPTGTGKSSIAMGVASLLGGRSLYLTQTKGLQAQLTTDFSPMGLAEIKGQANYPCLYFEEPDRTNYHLPGCDEGPCHANVPCIFRDTSCYYYSAVRRASKSNLVNANYSYWMHTRRFSEPFVIGKFDNLILDEAHDAAQSLADFVQIYIDRSEVSKLLDLAIPGGSSIDEWVEWARHDALPRCKTALEGTAALVSLSNSGVATLRRLKRLDDHLTGLAYAMDWKRVDAPDPPAWVPGTTTDWVIEEHKDGVTFQPVWASGYAEAYLFAGIPRVFLVSATVTPKDAQYLGIPRDDLEYLEYPSPFKREIRPVFSVPTVRVGRKMVLGEERIWVNRIDQIIEKEAIDKNHKGIIHSVSYDRAQLIFAMSKHSDIIEIHDRKKAKYAIERYRRADPPYVLLSPSVSTGWDFPMDEARFQIIAKMPFIDSRPAVIGARARADRQYLDYVALVTLIQMCGRGVRSEDDYCITYIIDDNFGDWFYRRNRKLIPKWFRSALHINVTMSQIDSILREFDKKRRIDKWRRGK